MGKGAVEQWAKGRPPGLALVAASLARAVRRGYLESNPAVGVRLTREPEKAIRVLTAEEVGRLLDACPSLRWRALVALALTTGMRRGELLALRWEDVDLDGGTIWVCNTPTHLTKSRRNRVLGLLPESAQLLRELPRSGELVFVSAEGNAWTNNTCSQFQRIVERAGIRRCTMHDLRRTFVSHLAMAGVNAAIVQKLAGHASITTTVKHYTGVMTEALRDAQARLPFRQAVRDVTNPDRGPHPEPAGGEGKVVKLYPQAG